MMVQYDQETKTDTTAKRLIAILENTAIMLSHQFEAVRGAYDHTGIIGSGGEEVVRRFLKEILPSQYFIGNGQIVSLRNGISRQADVVIADAEHPILFRTQANQLFFVESGYGIIEVKSKLDSKKLRSGIENIKSFKELPRDKLPVSSLVQKGGNGIVIPEQMTGHSPIQRQRGANPRQGAIFAFGSRSTMKTLPQTFAKEKAALPPEHRTDAVCVLGKGIMLPVSSISPRCSICTYSETHTGWAYFDEPKQALALFFLQLMLHITHTQLLTPDISRLLWPGLNDATGRAIFPPEVISASGHGSCRAVHRRAIGARLAPGQARLRHPWLS